MLGGTAAWVACWLVAKGEVLVGIAVVGALALWSAVRVGSRGRLDAACPRMQPAIEPSVEPTAGFEPATC
jgi:hypothetical protein